MPINCKPINRNENPMRNSPIDLWLLFLLKSKGVAKPINGIANA